MKTIFRILIGIFIGFFPVLGFGIVSFFILDTSPNNLGICIVIFLSFVSIYIGIGIYKEIQISGIVEFLTAVHASPDLDNIEPSLKSNVQKLTAKEISDLIESNLILCKGGNLRIFGDYNKKPFNKFLEFSSSNFNRSENILTIRFVDNFLLEIYNPNGIIVGDTFIRIIYSDRIKYSFRKNYIDYINNNKSIRIYNNMMIKDFNTSLGANSLEIFGKF